MAKEKLIIFDLDGTIHDSSAGISYCFRKTGETYGITSITDEKIKGGLTGPFDENIAYVLDLEPEEVPEAIDRYAKFFIEEGRDMARMFPDTKDTLKELRNRGYMIGLATMMEQNFAVEILQNYEIYDLFDSVNGASFTIPLSKYDLIMRCIESLNVRPDEAVMVGEGPDDRNSAVKAGVRFIGARYGYGMPESYCKENNIEGIDRPSDLLKLF